MAAKTPDSIGIEKTGTGHLVRCEFTTTNLDDTDTYASGMTGIVDYWFVAKNNPTTQASTGMHVTESSGTFTFYPGEDNCTGTLFVLKRG